MERRGRQEAGGTPPRQAYPPRSTLHPLHTDGVTRLVRALRRDGLVHQPVEAVDGPRVRIAGRWLLNFTSTGYLGLGQDPCVRRALCRAAGWGLSLAAPRLLAADRLS